jgi:hypothetical protein
MLLFLAGITAVVFSVIPEKARELTEYVYILCVLSPVLFWWVLDGAKKER